jgi:hypothetical protein
MLWTKWRPILAQHSEHGDSVDEVLDRQVSFEQVHTCSGEKRADKDASSNRHSTKPQEERGADYLSASEAQEQRISVIGKRVRKVVGPFDENQASKCCVKRP